MSTANLTEDDFDWATQEIHGWAARFCDNRRVSGLEGGYVLNALGRCAARHIQTLLFARDPASFFPFRIRRIRSPQTGHEGALLLAGKSPTAE